MSDLQQISDVVTAIKNDVETVKKDIGQAPNPATGEPGTGIQKTLSDVVSMIRDSQVLCSVEKEKTKRLLTMTKILVGAIGTGGIVGLIEVLK